MLYDSTSARLLLGALMIKPNLALSEKYPLSIHDFQLNTLHIRLYQAISALAKRGAETITDLDI